MQWYQHHLLWRKQDIESTSYTKFQYNSTDDPKNEKIIVAISEVYAIEENLLFYSGEYVTLDYKSHRAWAENLSIVMQIGLTMAGCIGFCFFVGLVLDRWLGIRGLFTVIFIFLGIAGGANVVYRQIMDIIEPKK